MTKFSTLQHHFFFFTFFFPATFGTWKCTIKYFVFCSVLMQSSCGQAHIQNMSCVPNLLSENLDIFVRSKYLWTSRRATWASLAEVYPTHAGPPCPTHASHRPTDVIIGWFRCLSTLGGGVAAKLRPHGPFGNSAVVTRSCSKPIAPIQSVCVFCLRKKCFPQISLFFRPREGLKYFAVQKSQGLHRWPLGGLIRYSLCTGITGYYILYTVYTGTGFY